MNTVIARLQLASLGFSLVFSCSPAPATVVAPPPTLASATLVPPSPLSPTPRPHYRGDPVIFQDNNSLPQYIFAAKTSDQLVSDSRLGSGAYSSFWYQNDLPNWSSILRQIANLGVKRLDTSLPEIEEPIFWEYSETEFPPEYDHFIDGLHENDIAVNYLLHFWDKEGRALGEKLSTPRFKTEEQIQEFLDYVRLVVRHFKGRVQYYTIWSEPDNCGGEQLKCIEPEDYIKLLGETLPIIREEDPAAKISLAPVVLFFDREYLFKVLESGVVGSVDVVQWHGIYIVVPGSEFYDDYYYEYPRIVEDIMQTARAHGFEGEFWGTEIAYCSEEATYCHAPDQPWGLLETDKLAAKYYARMIVKQLGMDVGTGLPSFLEGTEVPWAIPAVRNLYTLMAGSRPFDYPVRLEIERPDFVAYTFETPNQDRLLALWQDGMAADNDPGQDTTLLLADADAQSAVGIDPLYGFEQQLATEYKSGYLVVRNVLVKDYPIIIKFSSAVR